MIERAKDAFNYDIVYHKFKMAPMDGESLEDLKKPAVYMFMFLKAMSKRKAGNHGMVL